MVRSGNPDGADGQQSLGELVALAAKDMSSLVRYEISLAKSELRMDARRIGIAAGLAIVGLFGACLVLVLLSFAYAYGLVAAGIWGGTWFAFIVAALTVVALIVVAVLIAWGRIRKVSGMKMTRQTVMDDLGMLRKSESSPNGSGPAVSNPEVSAGTGTPAEIPPVRK
jgi:Putative Actinobacterial Holin-X, holin superfamily III